MKKTLHSIYILFSGLFIVAACSAFASSVNSYSYTQIIETPGNKSFTTDVWIKDENMRVESNIAGATTVTITREDGVYNYIPAQNIVTKMPPAVNPANYIKNPSDFVSYIKSINAAKLGTEEIDNNTCHVYKYTDKKSGAEVKVWIWTKNNFPLKMVIEEPFLGGNTTVLFKNIKINTSIPDSTFEIPSGVQVIDTTAITDMLRNFAVTPDKE